MTVDVDTHIHRRSLQAGSELWSTHTVPGAEVSSKGPEKRKFPRGEGKLPEGFEQRNARVRLKETLKENQ